MKNLYFFKYAILLLAILQALPYQAQVGIGTSAPQGMLDISSSSYGVVYPVVALSSTAIQLPVTNPNGGNLVQGTVVYNTNTNILGSNSVYPGTYMWNGSIWVPQFTKRQSKIFEQTAVLRTSSSVSLPADGYEEVPGFKALDNKTFTAKYSGKYRVELRVNYGGGEIKQPGATEGQVNAAAQEGTFRFKLSGTDYFLNSKSVSTYNKMFTTNLFVNIWKDNYYTFYITMISGQSYPFNLAFNQTFSDGFVKDGNKNGSNDGRGYIGVDIPCTIEFTYIDE